MVHNYKDTVDEGEINSNGKRIFLTQILFDSLYDKIYN